MIHKSCIRQECDNEFDSKDNRKIYCSRSCAAIVNNSKSPKRKKSEKRLKNDLVKVNRKTHIQKWIDGEWDGTTKEGLSSAVRNYLLKEAEYRCQDGRSGCDGWSGYNPKSGKSCLTVDHTDGNCMNNKQENLVVMCPNCHSMTPTYGALNKGNGRKFRYESLGV